jgi:hypothetical protein
MLWELCQAVAPQFVAFQQEPVCFCSEEEMLVLYLKAGETLCARDQHKDRAYLNTAFCSDPGDELTIGFYVWAYQTRCYGLSASDET